MILNDRDISVLRKLIMVYKLEYNFNHDFRKSKYTDLKIKNVIPALTKIDEKLFESLSEAEQRRIFEKNQKLFES
jgi:hypothetical protein